MSSYDKMWMARGYRVRHSYKRRHGCLPVCIRCGVKRRRTTSGWEYAPPGLRTVSGRQAWSSENPPCVKRAADEADALARDTGDAQASDKGGR